MPDELHDKSFQYWNQYLSKEITFEEFERLMGELANKPDVSQIKDFWSAKEVIDE
jgi:hypothetical protein